MNYFFKGNNHILVYITVEPNFDMKIKIDTLFILYNSVGTSVKLPCMIYIYVNNILEYHIIYI